MFNVFPTPIAQAQLVSVSTVSAQNAHLTLNAPLENIAAHQESASLDAALMPLAQDQPPSAPTTFVSPVSPIPTVEPAKSARPLKPAFNVSRTQTAQDLLAFVSTTFVPNVTLILNVPLATTVTPFSAAKLAAIPMPVVLLAFFAISTTMNVSNVLPILTVPMADSVTQELVDPAFPTLNVVLANIATRFRVSAKLAAAITHSVQVSLPSASITLVSLVFKTQNALPETSAHPATPAFNVTEMLIALVSTLSVSATSAQNAQMTTNADPATIVTPP